MSDSLEFTASRARAALNDILEAVNLPDNAAKLNEAKEIAGNDMMKMMQYVFPIMVQIQMDIIKNFGFEGGRDGIVRFSQLVRNLEREDPDIAQLHGQIRAQFLPPVNINTEASL